MADWRAGRHSSGHVPEIFRTCCPGFPLERHAPGTASQPQTLRLSGPGITTVVIDAPQTEVWLIQFNCQ